MMCEWQGKSQPKLRSMLLHFGSIFCMYVEVCRYLLYLSKMLYNRNKNPLTAASTKPFRRGSWGQGMLGQQNHAAGGASGSIMVGMFLCLYFSSQNPSGGEFLVPAGTDLPVNSVTTIRVLAGTKTWCSYFWCRYVPMVGIIEQ